MVLLSECQYLPVNRLPDYFSGMAKPVLPRSLASRILEARKGTTIFFCARVLTRQYRHGNIRPCALSADTGDKKMTTAQAAIERRLMESPVIRELLMDLNRSRNEYEEKQAKADPAKHKLSRIFANSRYRYYDGGRNKRNQQVLFCYSSHRNVAGYFLGWREVIGKEQTKRDRWTARKSRAAVRDIARNRYNKFIGAA